MFRKLLKYDFAAVLRVWWIITVCFIGISVLGIVSMQLIEQAPDEASLLGVVITLFAGLGMMIYAVSLGAYLVLSELFIFLRFYRNLFSDEGYLTFSLPVKRSTIYLSKTLSAFILMLASYLVFAASLIAFILSTSGQSISEFFAGIREIFSFLGLQSVPMLVSAVLLALAWVWYSVEMIQFCITIGSVIAQRAKFIAGVGIYAGISSGVELLLVIGAGCVTGLIEASGILTANTGLLVLMILLGTAVFGTIAAFLHCSTASRIERRLNLA